MDYEQLKEHGSQWEAIGARSSKIECSAQTFSSRARRDGIKAGKRPGVSSQGAQMFAPWPDVTCVGSLPPQ